MNTVLSPTIDPLSSSGVDSHTEHHAQVRNLTSDAERLLARGAVEEALDPLQRAYLLDPTAPEVLACEQHVIPAWELLRGALRALNQPASQTCNLREHT